MNQTVKKNSQTITNLLNNAAFKNQLVNVLPKTLTPDRLVRIAMTEMRMNPKLGECDPMSFAGAIMRCAQIGLEPSSERGFVHLIPFNNRRFNRVECQVIIGYRGFLALATRSNIYIECDVVYENDDFEFQKGLDTKLKLIPYYKGDRGKIIGSYAMARVCLPDSTIIYIPEFMPKPEIDKIMVTSKSYSKEDSPWRIHYDSMARKSAIRRLFKYIPLSPEIDAAVSMDELADRDAQNNASLLAEEVISSAAIKEEINDETPAPQSKAEALADHIEHTLGMVANTDHIVDTNDMVDVDKTKIKEKFKEAA
jgi:recombination protein RecT